MNSNSPNPPSKFWKLPLYLGRTAFVLAVVPMAMLILCIVTKNSVYSLIDLNCCFVTPLQICKWSAILTLIFSFLTSFSASLIYKVDNNLHWDEYRAATRLSSRAMILIIAQVLIFFIFRN